MSSAASIYLDQRALRGQHLKRYALTLLVSLLLHLLVLVLVAMWSGRVQQAPSEEEIFVPLSIEEPQPENPPPPAAEPEQAPVEPAEAEQQPPVDRSLFGFEPTTEEEIDEPIRPPGPEELVHAPAVPNPEGDLFGATDVTEDPGPVPPETTEQPAEQMPEEIPDQLPERETAPDPQPESPPEEIPEPEELNPDDAPEEPGEEAGPDSGPVSIVPEPQDQETPGPSQGAPEKTKPRIFDDLPPRLPPSEQRPRRAPDLNVDINGGSWGNNIRFDTMNDSEYSSKVYWAIFRAWLRELWNNRMRFGRDQALYNLPLVDGRVSIHFVIHRDGSVDQLSVVSPSTMPTLDQASEAALRAVVLPHLPEEFAPDQEGVTFSFALIGFPSAQALEHRLRISKSRGEF